MNTAPTNLVIPRVFIVSWEQEADAAKPTRREYGCDSWKEYLKHPDGPHYGTMGVTMGAPIMMIRARRPPRYLAAVMYSLRTLFCCL